MDRYLWFRSFQSIIKGNKDAFLNEQFNNSEHAAKCEKEISE